MEKHFAQTETDESRDPWLRFSASEGMADYTPADADSETVFHRADQMMYEYKQTQKKGRKAFGSVARLLKRESFHDTITRNHSFPQMKSARA